VNAEASPAISVVVPSHGRRLRLRWLLNALEEQTLASERYEVIVAHDYEGEDAALIDAHPLARGGSLRSIGSLRGTGPAAKRNKGWRAARAPLVAFTDDDCRPAPDWLERLLEVTEANHGDIVQGSTAADPYEKQVLASPHARSQRVRPPDEFAQTCNIVYPRDLLERVDGFDENLPAPAGEDTDVGVRARATGADLVAAPDAVVYHAVEAQTLLDAIRFNFRWRHLGFVLKRHPQLRAHFVHGIFWRRAHRDVLVLVAGALLARRVPLALVLTIPWMRRRLLRRGRHKRAIAAGFMEMPGGLAVDLCEVAAMCWGSARYRTPML
jgi:GT2 family glycosyltransferase